MIIDRLLQESNLSGYKLSKMSGVPQATISDICSGKAALDRCTAGTVYKLAKALNVTVESLLEADKAATSHDPDYRSSFEAFKSNICHQVKDMGDLDFIIKILETDQIRKLYNKKWYPEALYLLGMVDYLSKLNGLPLCTNYNDIRSQKLERTIYPTSVLIRSAVLHSDDVKKDAQKNAIPEFMRFNIVENEVRNLV